MLIKYSRESTKDMEEGNKNNEGIDLSDMLKSYRAGAKFEEYQAPASYYPQTPKIIRLVMKLSGGLIKDEKQASYALLGFVVIALVVTFIIFFGVDSSGTLEKRLPIR